jgi:ferredoxin
MPELHEIRAASSGSGLSLVAAFAVETADAVPAIGEGRPARTLVLLGAAGGTLWPAFAASPEHRDGAPHPLDRWSRRVVGVLARAFGAAALVPFDGPPFLPFQRWARRAAAEAPSPLGLSIHPTDGLWRSWRGALAFAQALDVPSPETAPRPCDTCGAPCLSACPVGAFAAGRYDVERCAAHLSSAAGAPCMSGGCLARRACPVAPQLAYGPAQAAFHMRAFRAARRPHPAPPFDRIEMARDRGTGGADDDET